MQDFMSSYSLGYPDEGALGRNCCGNLVEIRARFILFGDGPGWGASQVDVISAENSDELPRTCWKRSGTATVSQN
jgi:hypothetical protein